MVARGLIYSEKEVHYYYPFGLKMQGLNSVKLNPEYKYAYNGMEFNGDFGLNISEMEFRQYNSSIGRFISIDLLNEKIPSINPYNFSFNNPIKYSDPSGLFPEHLASTFVDSEGNVIEHRDDDDPTVYMVFDENEWRNDGKSKKGLAIVGFEDWRLDYKKGDKYTYYNPTKDPDYKGQYLIPSYAYDYSQGTIEGKFSQDWAYILYGNKGTMVSRYSETFNRDWNADSNQHVKLETQVELSTLFIPVPKGASGWIVRKVFNKFPPQLKAKFVKAIAKGVVPPTGNTGIIKLTASEIKEKGLKGYTHKLKILGKGGDTRIYGKMGDNGHIVFDKILGH